MYLKRYTLAAFVLMALVWLFVSNNVAGGTTTISIDLFGVPLPSFSVAFWVVVPLFVLYLGSIAHFSFYSLLGSFKLRKYEKDYEKIIDAMVDAYLGKEDRDNSFKTERYQLLGEFIDNTTFHQNKMLVTDNPKLNKVIDLVESIKNGEVVELKGYSLDPQNALVNQNNRNKYKSNQISAEDILSRASDYSESLCQEVYSNFVETAPLYAIEQYKQFITKETLYKILARINASENTLEISNEVLIAMFKDLDLTKKDYINIATTISLNMIPEQRMKLLELVSLEDEEAMEAYLYTLFDLEMNSLAEEILHISQKDEFLNFKAYLALKKCNKNFNIKLFI
jgi:hypothetical protein